MLGLKLIHVKCITDVDVAKQVEIPLSLYSGAHVERLGTSLENNNRLILLVLSWKIILILPSNSSNFIPNRVQTM